MPTHEQRMAKLSEITETVSRSDDFAGCDVAVLEWASEEIERLREALAAGRDNCNYLTGVMWWT